MKKASELIGNRAGRWTKIINCEMTELTTEQLKAIEWLRSYKIWEDDNWKTHEWKVCRLGGYCYNKKDHENNPERNWKDYDEEKGEQDYNYYLLAQEGRTRRVSCECKATKPGNERILFIKEKGRKTWDNRGWFCRDHVQERAEWYIKNQEPNLWAKKGGPVLQEKPVWGVNFEEAKRRAEELTKKPFRT